MLKDSRTVVIWNPSAGAGNGADKVQTQLRSTPGVELQQSESREHAIHQTIVAADDGADVIVAAGGDGSVNSVVEGLMHSDRRPMLGILPLGTGNDLARSLNIPLEPLSALQTLTDGHATLLDAVQLSSTESTRWYANMLTGGNTGRYLRHLTDEIKQRWGPFCYLRGMLDILQDLQVYEITVTCDDGPVECFAALNVFIANGRSSGGGLAVSPEARLDDGCVDVVVVQEGEAGEIASLTSEYIVADYLQHPLVAFRRARRVTIAADPPMPITADGDEVGLTPLSVIVSRQCLQVIIPGPDVD